MISIVVDGRNDSHGQNSHKRVALSLNCLASVLTEQEDEILFVDFNSVDDVPTFPEAIEDLLTDHTKRRLRILRVPSSEHRRLALPGSGNLLDVIARNVGLRRSNPANRWILSTTTDIVVVPHRTDHSLTETCRGLPDGFYALPRFEVPAFLWESVDRHDPEAIRTAFRIWGERFHLHEAVMGVPEVVFDACGDFQLFLRSDAFAIGGFDERMIAGWQHSDASLQRRLGLLRGGISSFTQHAYAYHCDHMRQAATVHRGVRLENDWDLFVEEIRQPELGFQLSDWGLPEGPVEEIRLPNPRRQSLISGLEAVLPPANPEFTVASRDHPSFDQAGVPVPHVLPFLADHLAVLPPASVVLFVGANAAMLRALIQLVDRVAGGLSFLVDSEPLSASLRREFYARPGVRLLNEDQNTAHVALCIFDFSLDLEGDSSEVTLRNLPAADKESVERIKARFLEETRRERLRSGDPASPRRKFVAINAVHTSIETLVEHELEAARAPFSTRLRHGFVRGLHPPDHSVEQLLSELGRSVHRDVSAPELSLVLSVIASCRRGQVPADMPTWAITPELRAALHLPWLVEACQIDAHIAQALAMRCDAVLTPDRVLSSSDERSGSRLCDLADWDDPVWRCSARLYQADAVRLPPGRRHRSAWERIQMLHAATRLNALRSDARIAVVSLEPDELSIALEGKVRSLDFACYREGLSRRRKYPPKEKLDAVFVPNNTAFCRGEHSLEDIVDFATASLVEGGLLVFSSEFVIESNGPHPWWGGGPEESEGLVEALQASGAFEVVGRLAGEISPDTLSSEATVDQALRAKPHGVLVADTHRRTSCIWVCRRTATPKVRAQSLVALLGCGRNLLVRAKVVAAGHWEQGALHVDFGHAGTLVRIQRLLLPRGRIHLFLEVGLGRLPMEGAGTLEVWSTLPPVRRAHRSFTEQDLKLERPIVVEFNSYGLSLGGFEIRLIGQGCGELVIRRLVATRVSGVALNYNLRRGREARSSLDLHV
jgi:hypothetical protein